MQRIWFYSQCKELQLGTVLQFIDNAKMSGQLTLDATGIEDTKEQLCTLIEIGAVIARKYDVVVTNPPYMGISMEMKD